MTSVTEINIASGEVLYRQGDPHDSGYIIASGEVLLFHEIDGKRFNIERRGEGAMVGEMSILQQKPRSVTVEALKDCRLFRISASQILNRFKNLDPVLRTCVETSIHFAGTFTARTANSEGQAPLAPVTLDEGEALLEQFEFEMDVLGGIERNEFFMVYQPIIAMDNARIVGFEALMRWVHPTRGFVPPDRFIQTAESIGAIGKLTDFAVMESCAVLSRMKAQKNAPKGLFVSINISAEDLCRSDFVDLLSHAVDLYELQPKDVKLEVTETSLICDFEIAGTNFNRLRALGFGISVDDFGTGYSNLAYLKSLPLTTIKIDRAFAGDAHENKVSRSIVRMLLTLGQELDVEIIAEGLETIGDVETLKELGCRYGQGFYFHKPLPEPDIAALFAETSPDRDAA